MCVWTSNTCRGTNSSSSSSQMRRSTAVHSTVRGMQPSSSLCSRLQPHLVVLRLQGRQVAPIRLLITTTAHPLEDHRKRPPVACGGAVGLGAVNRIAVMDNNVAGLEMNPHRAGLILRSVIGDPLRKAKDVGAAVGAHA